MQHSTNLHPVHNYQSGLIATATGNEVNLYNPQSAKVDINDIACGLSKICRFGGQTSAFYSVAQHSVLVASLAPDHLKKEALLHDAAEAYIGDVIKPLKHIIGIEYQDMEAQFNDAISSQFNIDLEGTYDLIKPYDMEALEMEQEALQKGNPGRLVLAMERQRLTTDDRWAWSHDFARRIFKIAYYDYFNL